MRWNWQQPDWPRFAWQSDRLNQAERCFLVGVGTLVGTVKHLMEEDRDQIAIKTVSEEALTTSEIEGEILDRASVQSSVRRQFGLAADNRQVRPAEQGISELMADLYRSFSKPVSHEMIFAWHEMLVRGRRDLKDVGRYRTSDEPMQVVSGSVQEPKLHFESPPSSQVPSGMAGFIRWFNRTGPQGENPLPALTRSGIAHLYFVCLHPFEDGNGRIGRALTEKSLAQSLGQPSLTALSTTILARRESYYQALEAANKDNEITGWLVWFAGVCLEAQMRTTALVESSINKTKLFDRLRGHLNQRQEKALLRMFREEPEEFDGRLSAGQFVTITGASPATATRDLADLVEKGALLRFGEGKGTRYQLAVSPRPVPRVSISEQGDVVEDPISSARGK